MPYDKCYSIINICLLWSKLINQKKGPYKDMLNVSGHTKWSYLYVPLQNFVSPHETSRALQLLVEKDPLQNICHDAVY